MKLEGVISRPGTITAGNQVVYEVTIKDEGVVAAGLLPDEKITVANTLDNGDFVGAFGTVAGCSEETPTKTCTIEILKPVAPGGSVSFRLIAQSPLSELKITITSKIEDLDLANTDPSDDEASASTNVIAGTGACTYQGAPIGQGATACSSGFFPGGTTVAFGAHSLIVPEGPGVIGELAAVGSTSTFCKTHVCRYGIGVLENFYEVGEFKVTDRSNPLRTIINTPKGDPCRGLGAKPCSVLRYEDRPAAEWHQTQVPAPVIPFCTENDTIPKDLKPALCIDHREKTSSGGLRFEVLLLSSDPGMY